MVTPVSKTQSKFGGGVGAPPRVELRSGDFGDDHSRAHTHTHRRSKWKQPTKRESSNPCESKPKPCSPCPTPCRMTRSRTLSKWKSTGLTVSVSGAKTSKFLQTFFFGLSPSSRPFFMQCITQPFPELWRIGSKIKKV